MEVESSSTEVDIKRWIIIYPVYINSKKTIAQGRRIRAKKACDNPTCIEIADSCAFLKLPCVIEADKAYPRDFMQRGRVRVQLKHQDGTPINPDIKSSAICGALDLICHVHRGESSLKNRVNRVFTCPSILRFNILEVFPMYTEPQVHLIL